MRRNDEKIMCVFHRIDALYHLSKEKLEPDVNVNILEKYYNCLSGLGETHDEKKHLLLFLQAISSVDNSYLKYYKDVLDPRIGYDYTIEESLLERTFAYELYRQWQNYLELFNVHNVRVDSEIGKKITNEEINLKKIKDITGLYKEPDLVLHSGQGVTDNHLIICEIKRNENLGNLKVSKDITKICHFLDPQIWNNKPYKYGCFIVVNKNLAELEHIITDEKNSILSAIKEKGLTPKYSYILCIAYNRNSVEWDLLSNILRI